MYLCFWQWEPSQREHRFVARETSRTEYDAGNAVTRIWLMTAYYGETEPLLLTEEKSPRLVASPSSRRGSVRVTAPFLCRGDEIKRIRRQIEDERMMLGLLLR